MVIQLYFNDTDLISQYQERDNIQVYINRETLFISIESGFLKQPGWLTHEIPPQMKEESKTLENLDAIFSFMGKGYGSAFTCIYLAFFI